MPYPLHAPRVNNNDDIVQVVELGVNEGDTIAFSAFQEGASDDWAVDWLEPASLQFVPMAVAPEGKLASTWANLKVR